MDTILTQGEQENKMRVGRKLLSIDLLSILPFTFQYGISSIEKLSCKSGTILPIFKKFE